MTTNSSILGVRGSLQNSDTSSGSSRAGKLCVAIRDPSRSARSGEQSRPKMADLPPCRLPLMKPPFYSTGVDCFGPFQVKRGRSTEKRWGIVFKCMTTSYVHLDILYNMDTDSFLMSLRRFVARRGTPFELLSDRGTNFRGGESEL